MSTRRRPPQPDAHLDELTQRAIDLLLGLPESTVYLSVGIFCWAEAAFFLGFVTPGELAIATGGILASRGRVSVAGLATVAVVGTVLGNGTGYWIGRIWGQRILAWAPLQRLLGGAIAKTSSFMERRGEWAVTLGRFATVTRIVIPFMAGASGISYRRYLAFDLPAVMVWATGWTLLGFFAGESWDVLWEVSGQAAFLVVFLVVVALVIRWTATRVARNQERVEAAILLVLRATGLGVLGRPGVGFFRWLVRRLDPRLAGGLSITLGFLVLLAGVAGTGLVLGQTEAVRGLALVDFPVLEWTSATRTDAAVRVSRAFLEAFHWPGMLGLTAMAGALLGWRVSGVAAARSVVGLLGSGLGALALDRLVLQGVVPGAEFPSVPVAVAAALLVHGSAGVSRWGGWGSGVAAAGVGSFLVCTVAVAAVTAGWAAPSGLVLGLGLGLGWPAALEVPAAILRHPGAAPEPSMPLTDREGTDERRGAPPAPPA